MNSDQGGHHEPGDAATPPVAARRPHEITAHGDTRVDDWYWLRDRDDPEVLGLLEAENEFTDSAMEALKPLEDELYEAILRRVRLTDVSFPTPLGGFEYYARTIEGKEHPVTCRRRRGTGQPSPDPEADDPDEVVILDENALAEGHDYFQIGDIALSEDQRLLAYAVDLSGGELMTVRLRQLDSLEDLDDVVDGAYYGLAFSAGGRELFYTRPDEAMRPYQIWRHTLGTPQGDDVLVWQEDDERFFLGVGTTKDHRYVVLAAESNVTSEIRVVPSDSPAAEAAVVVPRRQGVNASIEHHDGEFLVLTNEDAVNFALHRVPADDLRPERWEVVLGHRDDVRLEAIDVVKGYALVAERGHATTAIRLIALPGGGEEGDEGDEGDEGEESRPGGQSDRVVEAPEAGRIALSGNAEFEATTVRYETTTLVQPRTLYELDLASGATTELWRQPVPDFDPSLYRTERRWAVSADGTEVPLTIAWRADRPEGPGPCLLYGYGSYEASSDPRFSVDRPVHPLLDRGVAFAVAHVRGGGELGRRWYLDGKLEAKHHSFEDFVACARFLVDEGWTEPARLASLGASAGGLLVAAALNADPGLFGAVVAEVPFVDCLTTMLDVTLPLTVTEQEEWGDPIDDPGAYRWIKEYSPYDNVRPAVAYPAVLATGGLNDPRVSYFEPAKWVQKLRAADPGNAARVLLRMEMSAGHGGPSGRYRNWRRWAFQLAFVADRTGAGRGPGQPQAVAGPEPGVNTTL